MIMALDHVDPATDQVNISPAAGFIPTNLNCGNPAIKTDVFGSRIVGGRVAIKNSWPWQCSIRHRNDNTSHRFGASVLSSRYLLTAAHCVNSTGWNTDDYLVVCGEHNITVGNDAARQILQVSLIIQHENYERKGNCHDYDIAVLKLATELSLNEFVHPICLPNDSVDAATECVVTGWGRTEDKSSPSSDILREVIVPIFNQTECMKLYPNNKANTSTLITDNMICAGYENGGKDSCYGDSGGPLVCRPEVNNRWFQHGIVSGSCGKDCAKPLQLGVYTNVTSFLKWIRDKTEVTPSDSGGDIRDEL
jgi:secreted trypsin-like serine protease